MSVETHLSEVRFDSLDMAPALLQGIEAAGFVYCTPVQALSLPEALLGRDIAGQAQTGTGKTAAFLLAAMNWLLIKPAHDKRRREQPRAVILAPTRELAIQIGRDAEVLGRFSGLSTGVVFGGADYDGQRSMLEEGVDILIATPGRMIDYFKQKVFSLSSVDVLVLDEADRMFDLGFISDVRYLMRRMPKPYKRLNMLFSATLSYRVAELAYEHMNNPLEVEIEPDRKTVERIRQVVYFTAVADKVSLLLGLLAREQFKRTILFVNTKRAGEEVAAYLRGNEINGALISGDVPQHKRIRLLEKFSSGELPVLVATDVAARGLHIPDVSHVINFDLPTDPEDYVHRIGRTARAGAEGDAISFACEAYSYHLPDIEEYIGHKIEGVSPESGLLVEPNPPVWREQKSHPGGGRDKPRRGRRNRNQRLYRGRTPKGRPGGKRD